MEHKRALGALYAGQQYRMHQQQHLDGSGRQVTDADVVAQVVNVVNAQQRKEQQQQQHQSQQ